MVPESVARQLVLVRYLLRLAASQVVQLEPLAGIGLLMQHDALELFLQLAREHLNAPEAKEFKDYFKVLDTAIGPTRLPYREAVLRLNRARVGLKHHATQPSRQDLAGFQQVADAFVSEATPLLFGIQLDTVSLALLVAHGETRSCLQRADGLIETDHDEAACAIAEAFARLRLAHGLGLLPDHQHRRAMHSLEAQLERMGHSHGPPGLVDLGSTVDRLWGEVLLLRSGIDTHKLAVFHRLMPDALIAMDGTAHFTWIGAPGNSARDALRFCYDFVVESALSLQGQDAASQRFNVPPWATGFHAR